MGLFGPPNVAKLKARGSVNGLLKALEYRDHSGVRKAAAEALGQIGDPRAVERLATALKDRDGDVGKAAAEALGRIGDPGVVEVLAATLKDRDWRVREAAAENLDKPAGI